MVAVPADISAHDMYGPESPQKHGTAPVFVRWVLPAAPLPAPLKFVLLQAPRAAGRRPGFGGWSMPRIHVRGGSALCSCASALQLRELVVHAASRQQQPHIRSCSSRLPGEH